IASSPPPSAGMACTTWKVNETGVHKGTLLTENRQSGMMSAATQARFPGTPVVVAASKKVKEVVSADDHDLIAGCLDGDTAAFGVLIRRYQDRLYHTVYRLVENAEDAQDVIQEAFLHAYQSLESFKGDSLFFTWLYRIAVNSAISLKRKRRVVLSI